jgi:hypothetical protein
MMWLFDEMELRELKPDLDDYDRAIHGCADEGREGGAAGRRQTAQPDHRGADEGDDEEGPDDGRYHGGIRTGVFGRVVVVLPPVAVWR